MQGVQKEYTFWNFPILIIWMSELYAELRKREMQGVLKTENLTEISVFLLRTRFFIHGNL
jgi:hypothetical protein